MTATQLNEALNSLWPELNLSTTVDRVIAGPGEAEIRGVGVCWMPYTQALRQLAALGVNVVVTHEPTFFNHYELTRDPAHPALHAAKAEKQKTIESLGLTVVRCHDVWDAIPEIGVPFEWGRFLGFGEPVKQARYMNLYEVPEATAREVARRIAQRTRLLGQPHVGLHGDPGRRVRTVALGTGCYSSPHDLFSLGADLVISVDDIFRAWIDGEWSHDTGRPVVMVNHGVSEEPAMLSLAERIRQIVPAGIPVHHLPQGSSYLAVGSD